MFDQTHAIKLFEVSGYGIHPVRAARLGGGEVAMPQDFVSAHAAVAAQRKMRRAWRVGKILACMPFVRAAAVCNSLAFGMVHEQSDIDLFIVAAPHHVWGTRFFVTSLLTAFRLRPGEATRDPICASFFIDESITDLSRFQLARDPYFYFWERSLLPLFGTHKTFEHGGILTEPFCVHTGAASRATHTVAEFFAQIIPEKFFQKLQIGLFPHEVRAAEAEDGTNVMWGTDHIKLHTGDRRADIEQKIYV